ICYLFFFFQAEDGIRDRTVTGVQTCALPISIRAAAEGRSVAISVEDRGPGIAARDLPHLFEPFYRGRGADRVRGSGLGLTIVKRSEERRVGKECRDRWAQTRATKSESSARR